MAFIKTAGTNVNLDTSEFVGGSGLLDTNTDTVQKALIAINIALDLVSQNFDGIMSSQDKIKLDSLVATSAGAVLSVAGRTGDVVLSNTDVTGVAPIASPSFTGTPAVDGRGNILTESSSLNGGYF